MATETEEVTVTGDPWASWFQDFGYLQSVRDAVAGASGNQAFAPPVPTLLPEFVVTPPAPPPPAPPPPPPKPAAPVVVAPSLIRGIPWLSFLVPMNAGPPGTGDAPDDPSTITDRYGLPPPPPPIEPTLAEPDLPPNWNDMAAGGDSGLLDPVIITGVPIPNWPVEMPPGERFFDVFPPPVTSTPRTPVLPSFPELIFETFPTPGAPYDFPGFEPSITADPGPGPAPAPTGTPRSDPVPGYPDLAPDLQPGDRTAPLPFNPTAPDIFGAPLPDIFADPIGDPITAPELPSGTRPDTRTPARPESPDFLVDFSPPGPTVSPFENPLLTDFAPPTTPPPETDTCKCDKGKKKKKKKREPRTVCYRGTYVQRAKGTTFTPKEQVPCESKPTTRKGATKAGQFPALGFAGGMTRDQAADLALQAVTEFSPIIEDFLKRKYSKPKKAKKPKRNRKAKTKPGRIPGTVYTSPFPGD